MSLQPKPALAEPIEKRKFTICVVDDDGFYREFLAKILSSAGHRVIPAADGDGLMAVLDAHRVDCIVLDYNLAAENGMQTFERLQKRADRPPPVVMLTAVENERVVIKAYRLGLDDFVLKRELRASELLGAIGRAVTKRTEELNHLAEVERLQRDSAFDAGTGLYSGPEIDQRLLVMTASAERRHGQFGVVLATLNDLQSISDRFGMVARDRVLRSAAALFRGAVRSTDICGRYDDATLICLVDSDVSTTLMSWLCARLDTALSFEFREGAARVMVSAMIGSALYPADGDMSGELIGAAQRNFFTRTNGEAPPGKAVPALTNPAPEMEEETDERRRQPRQRVLKRGRLVLENGRSTMDCTIRDLSAGGARLRLAGEFPAPKTFELIFLETNQRRKATRLWQNGAEIGVVFLD